MTEETEFSNSEPEYNQDSRANQPEISSSLGADSSDADSSDTVSSETVEEARPAYKSIEEELNFYRQRELDYYRSQYNKPNFSQPSSYIPQQPSTPAIDPKAEEEYLSSLSEIERVNYLVNKATAKQELQLQQLQLLIFNQDDRAKFTAALIENPQLKRFEDVVETKFQEYLSKGQVRSREEILDALLGAEVRKKGTKAVSAAKKAGAENIRKQAGSPMQVSSTIPAKSDTKESARDRLFRRLREGAYRG
jgi:hypothetical protein